MIDTTYKHGDDWGMLQTAKFYTHTHIPIEPPILEVPQMRVALKTVHLMRIVPYKSLNHSAIGVIGVPPLMETI